MDNYSGKGKVLYISHPSSGALKNNTYPVIVFETAKEEVTFYGSYNLDVRKGDVVDILYPKNNETEAIVNCFASIWLPPILYLAFPLLVWVIAFASPGIINKNKIFVIGNKSYISKVE